MPENFHLLKESYNKIKSIVTISYRQKYAVWDCCCVMALVGERDS